MKKPIFFLFLFMMGWFVLVPVGIAANPNPSSPQAQKIDVQVEEESTPTSPTTSQPDPFDEAKRFQQRARQLMNDSLSIWGGLDNPSAWTGRREGPLVNTDVKETPEEFILMYDLPGVKKEDIQITLEKGILTISGTRTERESEQEKKGQVRYYARERYQGSFVRSFTLPTSVKENQIQAHFENGVLTIRIPKAESTQAKVIPVQ